MDSDDQGFEPMPPDPHPEAYFNVRDDDLSSNCSLEKPPNQALHADGARFGETTVVLALGDRPLGAGAAGERQGVGEMRITHVVEVS